MAVLLVLPLMAGCNNIWEWSVDDSSYDALMAAGRQAIQDADYQRAEEKFTSAVEQRPDAAAARYYLAKAAVLNAEVDVFTLVQILTDGTTEGGASQIFGFDRPVANSIYRVNATVLEALEPIRGGETVGEFSTANVDLDLAVAYTLRGILRLRDTNGDGVIDDDDLSPEDFGLGDDGDFSLEGLQNLPPEELNDMIDDMNDLLEEGGDLLLDALGDVLGDSGVDVEDLSDLIDDLGGDISAYYVNTGVPGNPGEGDNDGDGLVDEECLNGIDDDGDGLIDEDSRLAGC